MRDKYKSFADLKAAELEGKHYQISWSDSRSRILVVAPHGGFIEPHTSLIARTIAGSRFSVYCFEGCKNGENSDLHITSHRFDEPIALKMVANSDTVIAIHGRADEQVWLGRKFYDGETIWLGGKDDILRDKIAQVLEMQKFKVLCKNHRFPGREADNICNRGRRGRGVQLEIPRTLRNALKNDGERLQEFASAVQQAIDSSSRA